MQVSNDDARAFRLLYPFGMLLLLSPLLEVAVRLWPLQWYLAQWRYQLELALVNAVPAVLLGALIMVLVAWQREDAAVLRLGGGLLVTFAVALIPVVFLLAVDGLQLRDAARSELRGQIRTSIIAVLLRGALAVLATAGVGLMALQVAKGAAKAQSRQRRSSGAAADSERQPDTLLVVGKDG